MLSHDKITKAYPNQMWNNSAMTKERWQGILAFKHQFSTDVHADPLTCPFMNKMVAESWLRSRQSGVDPLIKTITSNICLQQQKEILKKNELLINVTKPLFDVFNDLIHSSIYEVALIEKTHCTCLLHENSSRHHPDTSQKEDLLPILSGDESTVGTCSHVLAMLHERPVQLIGPEHYHVGLEDVIASSAPVFDEKNNVIAALTLISQINTDSPWEKGYQILSAQTLALITAMAKAIEAQLKLHKSEDNNQQLLASNNELANANRQILTAHDLLRTTFSLIDEGIITIDYQGYLLEINQTARKMLQLPMQQKEKINISSFLSEDSLLLKYVSEGKSFSDKEEVFRIDDKAQTFIVSMKLIFDSTNKPEIAVLRFQNVGTYNLNATKRAGTKAIFQFNDMIGKSKPFQETLYYAKKFARSSENILLIGESGTGKELFAQSIHNAYRPEGPFIALNCAAIPRTLIESELFGYESGSFTGADRHGRPGKIELADKGTLFLDEIGDMPLDIQAVLLRVLEEKKVMRIGGRKEKEVDFRVIAATNKDLKKMVNERTFREDIYFRLAVLNIKIPPLRARSEDIERLCQHFLSDYCRVIGRAPKVLDKETLQLLVSYNWPGNIRQLENAIVYGINISESTLIEPRHLPEDILGFNNTHDQDQNRNNQFAVSGKSMTSGYTSNFFTLQEMERNAIIAVLNATDNNITKTAKILNISVSTLSRRIKEYNL